MGARKQVGKYVPILDDQGINHVVAAGTAGAGLQVFRVTQVGASPFAFNFVARGGVRMADANYIVMVQGPNGDERADHATRTINGFNITGGADGEVHIVFVWGRLAGQS